MFDKIARFFSGKKENTPPTPPPVPQNEPIRSVTPTESEEVSKRILLAEDDRIIRKVAARQLKKLGYEVDAVVDGQEAVDAIANTAYGLILMDCQMPVMNGYEATRTIRQAEKAQRRRRMPIIAMTANFTDEDRERCKDAGMDDFITKPVKMDILGQLLEKWLE